MTANKDIIRATYEGSAAEKVERLTAALAPDAQWTEAAGFPYAGTYTGPDAIFGSRQSGTITGHRRTCFWKTAIRWPHSASIPAPIGRRERR